MKVYPLLTKIVSFVWVVHRKLFVSLLLSLTFVLLILRAGAFYIEQNPQLVKQLVETHFQTRVDFTELKVGIHLFSPYISMRNFAIKDKKKDSNVLEFSSASIHLNLPLTIFKRQLVIDTLSLKGFSAYIHRNLNDEISIAKFQLSGRQYDDKHSSESLNAYLSLLKQANFIISDSEIYFVDEKQEIPEVFISDIDFKMKNHNDRHQLSLLAKLNKSDTRLDFRLDFKGKINDITNWNGKVFTSIENLNKKMLLHFLQKKVLQVEEFQLDDIKAKTSIWSNIYKGNLQSVHGELSIDDVSLKRLDNDKQLHFNTLSTLFKLKRKNNSNTIPAQNDIAWELDLFDLKLMVNSRIISDKHLNLQYKNSNAQALSELQIFIDKLEIDAFSSIIAFFSPMDFNKNIYAYLKPRGSLENIYSSVQFNMTDSPVDIKHYQVQTEINAFGINSFQALPKIRNFSAQLIFNEDHGQTIINSSNMKLHLKSLFRDSWPIDQFSGILFWQKEDDDWLFGGENLLLTSPHYSRANADFHLWFSPVGDTFMDLKAFYNDVNVAAISNYIPAKVMSQGLVEWLDMSLISGLVPDGGIVFRGELGEFPYLEHNGNLDIVFNTQDVLLEYQKDWPKLSHIDSQVQFTQKGMQVDSTYSQIYSAESHNVKAVIDDYLQHILTLTGDINTNILEGRKYLDATGLVSQEVLAIIDAEGDIGINIDLMIPMDGRPPVNHVAIKLQDVDYYPPGFARKKELVSRVNGHIIVDNKIINSTKLSAQIMQLPATVEIKTSKPSVAEKNTQEPNVHIKIDTEFSVKQLKKFEQIPESIAFISQYISGKSLLKADIDIPNNQHGLLVTLKTDFKNISSTLPAPFNKEYEQSRAFFLSYAEDENPENNEISLLKINYENDLSMIFLLGVSSDNNMLKLLSGSIAFAGEKAILPVQKQLKLTGSLRGIPFNDWKKVSEQSVSQDSKNTGRFIIPVELAMTELVLPELDLLRSHTQNNVQTAGSPPLNSARNELNPEDFPLLNGYIESLKFGELDLGYFKIQSSRVDKNIVFDKLSLEGELFAFNGSGKWHRWNVRPEVDIEGSIDIPSLEKMANAFGNDQLIHGGKAKISGYLSWPGGLSDISKSTIDGKLKFDVEQGVWIEGKPGAAGRLLGLLNMNALARRLSLDFSDVSDKGFDFDKIEGDFRFRNATAHTDNLRIFAPSAKILVTGSTGLVNEKIDQRVTVIPEFSATLPLAGAAVAGPAGAAVAWVGQRLLGDQLNRVSAFDYTIKGNWDKPIIEREKTGLKTLNSLKQLFNPNEVEPAIEDGNSVFDINSTELP